MLKLANKIITMIPHSTKFLIDIANVKQRQLDAVSKPFLISTQKTFNFLHHTTALPYAANGTRWCVLCVPHSNERGETMRANFDESRGYFSKRRSKSPYRVTYSKFTKPSTCRIQYKKTNKTLAQHKWCELDDLIIALCSITNGIQVVSNDRELQKNIKEGNVVMSNLFNELASFTKLVTLVYKNGKWVQI